MARGATINSLPLSARQIKAVIAAAVRQLAWGRPQIDRETRKWSRLAAEIPDAAIHADALKSFESKRGNVAGAVLFASLPSDRSEVLLRTLVTYQTIFDFLDDLHERHPTTANGQLLYLALTDALIPGGPISDYYAEHPWTDDAGYLNSLVEACRRHFAALPSFERVQPLLIREARRAHEALALGHLPNPDCRDRELRHWAEKEFPNQEEWPWFELTAAASGQLASYAVLALATKSNLADREIAAIYDAYWPLVPILTTMLDSFVDQAEDADNGKHQYVSHYREPDYAVNRMTEMIEAAAKEILELPEGPRHAVIFGCLITFYLTKDSARTPVMEPGARQLLDAGGSLMRALTPVLRIWRTAYAQRAA
jgi:tetraprenyl-beta-curcumene synthase